MTKLLKEFTKNGESIAVIWDKSGGYIVEHRTPHVLPLMVYSKEKGVYGSEKAAMAAAKRFFKRL